MTITREQLAAIAREIRRELEQRRRFYPGRVEKGRMLKADAEHEIALAEAWLEDAGRMRWLWFDRWRDPASSSAAVGQTKAPEHAFSWRDRVAGITRELAMRDKVYPGWIASGRMTERQAADQVAALEALREVYEDGWDWRAGNGALPGFAALVPTPEQQQARDEWADHIAAVDQARGTRQEELAL